MNRKAHWENVYASRQSDDLGWYEPHLQISLDWINALQLAPDAAIIDIGGGASTLVDDLLLLGHRNISVLDISDKALSTIKTRLAADAERVNWLAGDITTIDLPAQRYALWHDRAVFHFLTSAGQQQRYREQLLKALQPQGHLIMGVFAPEAPPQCSGLPVQRYSLEQITNTLGEAFELKSHRKDLHITPGGVEQMYLYCHFQRTA